jgi:hypothetical protein
MLDFTHIFNRFSQIAPPIVKSSSLRRALQPLILKTCSASLAGWMNAKDHMKDAV